MVARPVQQLDYTRQTTCHSLLRILVRLNYCCAGLMVANKKGTKLFFGATNRGIVSSSVIVYWQIEKKMELCLETIIGYNVKLCELVSNNVVAITFTFDLLKMLQTFL